MYNQTMIYERWGDIQLLLIRIQLIAAREYFHPPTCDHLRRRKVLMVNCQNLAGLGSDDSR